MEEFFENIGRVTVFTFAALVMILGICGLQYVHQQQFSLLNGIIMPLEKGGGINVTLVGIGLIWVAAWGYIGFLSFKDKLD